VALNPPSQSSSWPGLTRPSTSISTFEAWITGSSPVMTTVGVATVCVTLDSRFNFQTATPHCSRAWLREGSCRAPLTTRGAWSAARRTLYRFASGIACEAMKLRKRIALRRSISGDFGRGDHTSGTGQARVAPLIRLAFAGLHPVLVQPFKAEPRSWPGR
jgi:hypothetical protein